MRIYIIRHGQTELNNRQLLQGRSDYPLNTAGIAQAEKAGERLRGVSFDHVFTSPLRRAVQTAEIVAPGIPPVVDQRLIEMDYGPYEGVGLRELPPEVLTFFQDFVHNPAPAGMEQLSVVVARAGNFLENLQELEGNVLISTHAIAMKGLLEYLTPESKGDYWSRYIGNCAIYTTEYKNGKYTVPKAWQEDSIMKLPLSRVGMTVSAAQRRV